MVPAFTFTSNAIAKVVCVGELANLLSLLNQAMLDHNLLFM